MFRMLRPGLCLATTLLLGFSTATQGADYLLDRQYVVGGSERPDVDASPTDYDAGEVGVAVAPDAYQALIVWSADDASIIAGNDDEGKPIRVVDDEHEIVGRMTYSLSLGVSNDRFRISTMGNDDETAESEREKFDAHAPVAVWNPSVEEFLVVWSGDDDTAPLVDDEFEIFAQRVSLRGELLGKRLRVSKMGNDGASGVARTAFGGFKPAVAVDPESGNYLITWHGDTDSGELVDEEFEVFGRVLGADGKFLDGQFRVSMAGDDTATDADARAAFDALESAVAFNPVSGNFVVAWHADGDTGGLVDGEHEIFAREVTVDGALLGAAATQISSQGPAGNPAFDALNPALAVVPSTGAMLFAWEGDTSASPLVDGEFEVYSQLVDSALVPLDSARRISSMGADSETDATTRKTFVATEAAVAWSETNERFLLTWRGDTDEGDFVNNEFEIFGRFLDGSGVPVSDEFNVSVMGNNGEDDAAEREKFDAFEPVVTENASSFIVLWHGDSHESGSGNGRIQIFGRRVAEESATLALALRERFRQPIAPKPIEVLLRVLNPGETPATNVRLHVDLTEDFEYRWEGCDDVAANGDCLLGELSSEETVDVKFVVPTDDMALGEPQSARADFIVLSDTAIESATQSTRSLFIGATVEVEGGNGALGLPWLALLGALGWLGVRRRRLH